MLLAGGAAYVFLTPGYPSDFPVYPGAELTNWTGNSFDSVFRDTDYVWTTPDPPSTVKAWYDTQLKDPHWHRFSQRADELRFAREGETVYFILTARGRLPAPLPE